MCCNHLNRIRAYDCGFITSKKALFFRTTLFLFGLSNSFICQLVYLRHFAIKIHADIINPNTVNSTTLKKFRVTQSMIIKAIPTAIPIDKTNQANTTQHVSFFRYKT